MNFAGGITGGLFGMYNNYLKYKNLKNQEYAERAGLENHLNQANNNLAITKEQAPLVPQQSAEGFAARGVGQSTFGAGMGSQWGQNPSQPTYTTEYFRGDTQVNPHGGTLGTDERLVRKPEARQVMTGGSGEGYGVGTGLGRARDLSQAMVSNATSEQKAAKTALSLYKKTIVNNRHLFYSGIAQDWTNAMFMMMM